MTPIICPRESEVLALVAIGQWPRQADTELVQHEASCRSCREMLAVALALREDEDADAGVARPVLPDARAVWQQAQWRARVDAVDRAARPVVAMQAVGAVVAAIALIGAIGWVASRPSLGGQLQALAAGAKAAATSAVTSAGEAAATTAGLFRFELPEPVLWLLAGVVSVGVLVVGVAVAVSMLADITYSREEGRARRPQPQAPRT